MNVAIEDIREIIESADTMVEMNSLKDDALLADQGIDSLDMANIFLLLEEKYGIKISDETSKKLTTINEIQAYLQSTLS